MKSLGVSSSFLRRWTVSASSDRMYAWRSCTWISYSVRRRRVLESDMDAGRNFEKPSRLGLLFLSNSFIAHPFSLDPLCAAQAQACAMCSKYRRLQKRKSRLAGNLPLVDMLNFLCFSPTQWLPCQSVLTPPAPSAPSLKYEQVLYPIVAVLCRRNEWQEYRVPRIKAQMPPPTSGRVAAFLTLLVTILVTILVARAPVISSAQGPSAPQAPGLRRELRIGAPGVPAVLDPGSALEGTTPLIARQVFDTLVAWREGSTDIEPALATRWNASRDGLVWSFTLREGVRVHDGSPLTSLDVAISFERPPGAGGGARPLGGPTEVRAAGVPRRERRRPCRVRARRALARRVVPSGATAPQRGDAFGSRTAHRISHVPDREGAILTKDAPPGRRGRPRSRHPRSVAGARGAPAAVIPAHRRLGATRGLPDSRRESHDNESVAPREPMAQ